jgi:CHASE2 domain-containing sensor protein
MTRFGAVLRWVAAASRQAWRAGAARLEQHTLKLLVLAALLLLPTYELFDIEMNLYDLQVKVKHLSSDARPDEKLSIVLVSIDDAARRADGEGRLNRTSPLSRRYLADVVDRLATLGPAVIVLDVFLDLRADAKSDDEALLRAVAQARSRGIEVVVACRLVPLRNHEIPVLPTAEYVAAGVRVGHSHLVETPSDSIVRRGIAASRLLSQHDLPVLEQVALDHDLRLFDVAQDAAGKAEFWFWSLAGAAWIARDGDRAAEGLRQLRGQRPFLIDFTLPPQAVFVEYSSAALLADRTRVAVAKHSIVLVGVSFEGSMDRHPTPLTAASFPVGKAWAVRSLYRQHLTGTQIQAYAMQSLAARLDATGTVAEVGEWWLALGAFGLASLVSFAAARRRTSVPGWSLLIVIGLYVVTCVIAFQVSGIYMPLLRPLVAFGLGYGLMRAMRRRLVSRETGSETT